MFSEIMLDELAQECIGSNPRGMAAGYLVKSLSPSTPRPVNSLVKADASRAQFYRRHHQVPVDKRERGGVAAFFDFVEVVHRAQNSNRVELNPGAIPARRRKSTSLLVGLTVLRSSIAAWCTVTRCENLGRMILSYAN
jgi:hypothetical protein